MRQALGPGALGRPRRIGWIDFNIRIKISSENHLDFVSLGEMKLDYLLYFFGSYPFNSPYVDFGNFLLKVNYFL